MLKFNRLLSTILIIFLLSNVVLSINVKGCKDIVAVGDATDGDYNLFLKVRDPSRPGLQVLCIVPKGYEYTYRHPWTGKSIEFKVDRKFIGVATKEDTIPNIVKAGMVFSDSGLAFGDADTNSNWKNPTKNAWDDFDWIRYACEKAEDEDEAVDLLTEDVVNEMHASAVSENLFVVGPEKGFVIEADAFHYKIKEIDDILIMSNYPKELWKTQRHKKLPIAPSFDTEKEKYVRKGRTVRLNSVYGVKIVDIGNDQIIARQVPFLKISDKTIRIMGERVTIKLGERETVGDYSVKLLDIDGRKAKISLSYVFKAWEDKMLEYIQPEKGKISLKNMINWSRLYEEDLEGLRPMCEDFFKYESVMIYKIPQDNYDILSSGWFSANHPCISIYIPVHICDTDIYDPYETGEAAELSLDLLDLYGHENLTSTFCRVEEVFLYENGLIEEIGKDSLENDSDVAELFTIIDTSMQKQAMLTQKIWKEAFEMNKKIANHIDNLWEKNYTQSLKTMKNTICFLSNISESSGIVDKIIEIVTSICESRIDAAESIGKNISIAEEEYITGKNYVSKGEYEAGFNHLQTAFSYSDMLLMGQKSPELGIGDLEKNSDEEIWTDLNVFLMVILCIMIIVILVKKKFND